MVRAEELGELRVGGEAPVEVGAQRSHDDRATLWIGGRAGEQVGEGGPLAGRGGGEQLLELVDGEEQASVGGERLERLLERIVRPGDEHGAKRFQGMLAGTQQPAPPGSAAGQRSRSERRQEPGAEHR